RLHPHLPRRGAAAHLRPARLVRQQAHALDLDRAAVPDLRAGAAVLGWALERRVPPAQRVPRPRSARLARTPPLAAGDRSARERPARRRRITICRPATSASPAACPRPARRTRRPTRPRRRAPRRPP